MSSPRENASRLVAARRDYLDVIPFPAAIFTSLSGVLTLEAANEQYVQLDGMLVDTAADHGESPRRLIERDPLYGKVCAFLQGEVAASQFEWSDGGGSGLHFGVRLVEVPASAAGARCCMISLIDRTAEVHTERSLRSEMLHDSLTGLPNRLAFAQAIDHAIVEDAGQGRFAVLVVDLTRFSRINESMGSVAGDELIVTVARRMLSTLRSGDMLARTGGDEFGILFRMAGGMDEAQVAARRLQATMTAPFRLSELEIRIECAIGCALTNDLVGGAADLVRNAQLALKRAKQSGRIEIYRPGEVTAARRRLSLETELRRAIENDDLTLAFQPLIDLASGHVSSFEALARWEHPERGSISPVEFIPVAEESGLIVPLGRWALDAATRTLADWDRRAGRPLDTHVAVNLSAIQLARDDVVAAVEGALARSGVNGDRLTLELTESAIIADPKGATHTLQGLKDLAATIAMDDFGTGYSSLAYLQKLPIDVLKIDRSFVSGMLADRDSVAIVRAVLSLAEALGMETTAEGVETAELAQTLAALGCTTGQGYYFARPLTADAALDYWFARNT